MDKDLIILKNEELETEDIKTGVNSLAEDNREQQDKLKELQSKIDALYKKMGKTKVVEAPKEICESKDHKDVETSDLVTYEELFEKSRQALADRGLDVESVGFNSFLSETELADVVKELDKSVPREDRWKKSDFIVVFVAALVGCIADAILGDRDNKLTGKDSKFSDWLNEFHETKFKHKPGAPIDYQGKLGELSFGGGSHRKLSRGHDLFRFVDGIKAFKEGKFSAVGYKNGVKYVVESSVNQYGNPYETMTLLAAIIEYSHHMLADLLSTKSLPFPGYSFLQESKHRDLRKLSSDMYDQGFNLKNIIVQAASTVAIEIIIRLYFSIQSVRKYKDDVEIKEDYSNWEAIKRFVKPVNKEKLHEMLLLAHTIVTAFNLGKIVITKNLSTISITEIIAVVNYGIKVLKAVAKRNREYEKAIYHSSEINDRWEQIGKEVGITDEILIEAMGEELVIA